MDNAINVIENADLKAAKRIEGFYNAICEQTEHEHVEKLSDLARHMYNEKLKSMDFHKINHVAGSSSSIVSCGYRSRHDCERAAMKCIIGAYDEGSALFNPSSYKCIVIEAAQTYGENISKYFRPFVDNLEVIAEKKNKHGVFEEMMELVDNASDNLKEIFEKELIDNTDYYSLYKKSYFTDQIEIEKQEYLVTDEFSFGRLLERAFAQNVDYSFSGHVEALYELRKDVVDHADSFYAFARQEYRDYVAEIENCVSEIGVGLPEFNEGESVVSFLARVSDEKEKSA